LLQEFLQGHKSRSAQAFTATEHQRAIAPTHHRSITVPPSSGEAGNATATDGATAIGTAAAAVAAAAAAAITDATEGATGDATACE